jgi:Transcriptional regulator
MGNNNSDNRIVKTKVKLKKSLLALLAQKQIDSISVTELCSNAGVNRNTFYSHYENPHKLLDEIETALYQDLIQTLMNADLVHVNFRDFLTSILISIYKNQDICTVLFGPFGDTEFVQNAIQVPRILVVESWKKSLGISEFEANLRYNYFAGGSISVIKDWVNSGYQVRIEVLAECLEKIIVPAEK